MALRLTKLKHFDKRTKLLINGYIHEHQKLLPWRTNSYYTIPELVNHICLSFYFDGGIFNQNNHGNNLLFIDNKTVEKINQNSHSVATIGEPISGQMCDIFTIEYQVNINVSTSKGTSFCPYIGFQKGIQSKIWKDHDGPWFNESHNCVGLSIYNGNKNSFGLFERPKPRKTINTNSPLKVGDTFRMVFNFVKAECYIYHNDYKLNECIALTTSPIVPMITLHFVGERVEITKYEFSDIS